MPDKFNSLDILGVRVDNVDWNDILDFCLRAFYTGSSKQISTINGEFILEARHNKYFQEILNSSDLNICDSTNVSIASSWLNNELKAITPGSDLVVKLSELAQKENKSVFLLGSKDNIAALASDKLKELFPKLNIAGTSNLNPTDEEAITIIKQAKPDILFVAYGAPKQEIWIFENKPRLPAKILVGVGGSFEMLAGVKKRAPMWLRTTHLEWLWRLIIEPKRIGRILNATIVFPFLVIVSIFTPKKKKH